LWSRAKPEKNSRNCLFDLSVSGLRRFLSASTALTCVMPLPKHGAQLGEEGARKLLRLALLGVGERLLKAVVLVRLHGEEALKRLANGSDVVVDVARRLALGVRLLDAGVAKVKLLLRTLDHGVGQRRQVARQLDTRRRYCCAPAWSSDGLAALSCTRSSASAPASWYCFASKSASLTDSSS
jgi:hypothetical protein